MQITFTRTGLRTYATLAARDDGVTIRTPAHDRPTALPHDIAHFVVERELGLRRGFWGCVADGAMFPGMTVVSGRASPRTGARSRSVIRDAGQYGTEAEVLVGTLLRLAEARVDPASPAGREALREMWVPARPSRVSLDVEHVRAVCDALQSAEQRWHSLPVGASMQVTWQIATRRRGH